MKCRECENVQGKGEHAGSSYKDMVDFFFSAVVKLLHNFCGTSIGAAQVDWTVSGLGKIKRSFSLCRRLDIAFYCSSFTALCLSFFFLIKKRGKQEFPKRDAEKCVNAWGSLRRAGRWRGRGATANNVRCLWCLALQLMRKIGWTGGGKKKGKDD